MKEVVAAVREYDRLSQLAKELRDVHTKIRGMSGPIALVQPPLGRGVGSNVIISERAKSRFLMALEDQVKLVQQEADKELEGWHRD